MSRKDRIAIVLSISYLLIPLGILADGSGGAPVVAIVFSSPLIAYWGYRFVNGNISFFKINEGDKA